MEDLGPTIWIVLFLVALLFVVLWGAMVFFLSFGSWIIMRARLPDKDPTPDIHSDWRGDGPQGPPASRL